MGNQISQNNQPINPLSKVIDYIATEYILTQNSYYDVISY